jgi:polyhydroxyalkanoate synthesis regulator phasin
MNDAAASEAARTLSRARWGSTRVRSLVDELVARVGEIEPEQADRLRERLEQSRAARGVAEQRSTA